MKSGLLKPKFDHRDYDYLKSHHPQLFGGSVPIFPEEFSVDVGIWCPNQNISQAITGIPTIPALPEGCTDYSPTDLCMDEDGIQLDPMLIEATTHANANGGGDIRASLDAAKKVFGRTAYFKIVPSGIIDAFDAARVAIGSAQPEKRAVSVGSKWYWDIAPQGVLFPPPDVRVDAPWHNYVVYGWKTINGSPYLQVKPWTGTTNLMSRETFNAIMAVPGTCMYTLSKTAPQQILQIDSTWVQYIVSYVRHLIGL